MRLGFAWTSWMLLAAGCAVPAPDGAAAGEAGSHRSFSSASRATSVQLGGTLRRRALQHPSIPVVVVTDCSEMTAFLQDRALDAQGAISGAPGETFRARVSAIRKPNLSPGGDSSGAIVLNVENRDARILPGRVVAVSFHSGRNPLILMGLAQEPDDG